jgi:transposase
VESQRVQGLLTARKLLKTKTTDLENGVRGLLLSFGLKLGSGKAVTFQARVSKLTAKDPFVEELVRPVLTVRNAMLEQLAVLEMQVHDLAHADLVCRRLMTAPGVGPITALAFRASIDEPRRFAHSRDVGPHFGLTPRTNQSGESDFRGGISKRGDHSVRSALVLAARGQLRRNAKPSWLKTWGDQVAARRGAMRANVAIARRLAITLHRMWVTESDFRWTAKTA